MKVFNGKMLRKRRKELGLSTMDVGAAMKLTAVSIFNHESGIAIPPDNIKHLYMLMYSIKSLDDFWEEKKDEL